MRCTNTHTLHIDCGQMASWYMFNAMGFYPMNPASAEYVVGSPIFDKVRVFVCNVCDVCLFGDVCCAVVVRYVCNWYVVVIVDGCCIDACLCTG